MKKTVIAIFAVFLILGWIVPASAHVLKIDRSISVLLHTDPDDDPIVGRPATLFFDITDAAGRFNPDACKCTIAISEGDKQLLNQPLVRSSSGPSIFGFSMPFVFPERAVYHVTVSGDPAVQASFQSFQVQYDLRVARENAFPTLSSLSHLFIHGDHSVHTIIILMGLIVCGIMFVRGYRRERQSPVNEKEVSKVKGQE